MDPKHACCELPPVILTNYQKKGSFQEIGGLNTYLVGSSNARRAVIQIYDVFGLAGQTLQGADRLAAHHDNDILVLVPDFFKGEPLSVEMWPIDSDAKRDHVAAFFKERADFSLNQVPLQNVIKDFKAKFENVHAIGALGLCWGGKMIALNSGEGTSFKASGQVHPGRLAKEDAKKITIPHIVLFSKEDGSDEEVKAYTEVLESKKDTVVEKYDKMHHGWMGARAVLVNRDNADEYERGYAQVAAFFGQYL